MFSLYSEHYNYKIQFVVLFSTENSPIVQFVHFFFKKILFTLNFNQFNFKILKNNPINLFKFNSSLLFNYLQTV